MKKMALSTFIVIFLLALPVPAEFKLLREFIGGLDGSRPYGSLISSGSTLYGMTYSGGDSGYGTVFKIQRDGTGFTLLHAFSGGPFDGKYPFGDLVLSGSTLYGMTYQGGDNNGGTIFKIQTNGNNFTLLYEFTGSTHDGIFPFGSLTLSGTTLYGMTWMGGFFNKGTIFKIETSGGGYDVLLEFSGTTADGSYPMGSLAISGSTLFGMTEQGGDGNMGIIFKIGTSGIGYNLIHEFAGSAGDGAYPAYQSLILSGSTLYGITRYGGSQDKGTIFKMQTDGSVFTVLHEFGDRIADGANPYGSLFLYGSTLYGMTYYGGSKEKGTVFKIQTDGSGYALLHEFAGGTDDGWEAYGSLVLSGSALLGMTQSGGNNNLGVIFSFPIPIDFIGTWDSQGVYYRNSETGAWVQMATPATLVTAGDLDGDNIDDLIGIWPGQGGVWVKYSQSGSWAQLSSTAVDIACGDMNGDGRDDLVATWDGQGVYYKDSISGAWVQMATPAEQVTAGDLDGDGKDDLIGIWPSQGGVWVKYSQSGSWAQLSSTAVDIAAGDMNGDGRDDLVATWDGQGVYYKDSISGAWVLMATPATLVAAGDLDGDNKADVIGIWPGQGGVWVKYSATGSWAQLSSTARHIAAGLMRGGAGGSATQLADPFGGIAAGPVNLGYQDMAAMGPGYWQFQCQQEKNLTPQDQNVESERQRVPGPGEYGFQCLEQENLVPSSETLKKSLDKNQHKKQ